MQKTNIVTEHGVVVPMGILGTDGRSVTSKKSPYVYKSCPKIITLEKWKILTKSSKICVMWAK